MPLPKGILDAPQLHEWLELYWWAYQDLSTCRPAGGFGGLFPIPWTAVKDYAEANDLDQDQTEDLVYFVRRMDTEFLRWYEKKHGNKSKRGPIQAQAGSRRKVGGLGSRPRGA
jgi:hypothetical protein